ncbi:hypothetical protein OEZ86_001014 [Tetradesmus obliquus]|nr:hypothetical protein OEZ86_001014 [Tetradesmus obliquus]
MNELVGGNSTGGAGVQCSSGTWDKVDLGCINTYKVDSQIFATMITSGVAGVFCLAAFCFLQTFISVYRGRLLSPQVAIKPPVYTGNGIAKYFYWAWATVSMKEKELLATAGMDALMFERLIVFGLQLMAPLTVVSCSALIPIHASSKYLSRSVQQFQRSNLMGLTMSNMQPGSHVLWVHFGLVWLYCLYAMWLLDRHYQWYVLLRQQYMTRGDSISTWLGHTPQQRCTGLKHGTGDPLLDRHVVHVDVAGDLAWAGAAGDDCKRLQRCLRARKPSVRFRNTVHVQDAHGSILPLHVSNYAVLVTDVPGEGEEAEEEEDEEEVSRRQRPSILMRMLQAAVWSWPCLLRQADLTDLGWASSWNRQSFRTLHSNQQGGSSKSMLFSDSMRQLIQQHQQQETAEQQQQQSASLQPAEQLHMPGRQQQQQQQQAAGRSSSAAAADTPAAAAADVAAGEPCCRTPRLAPLKPRPVLPDEISKGLKPRLVSKDDEEGSTAMGRCCAGLAGALFGGPGAEEEEGAARDGVGCVAERLEVQRQALVDLEASILEAQKEVLSGPDTGSFIVLFKTPAAATLAARSSVFPQSSNSLEAFKVQPAPSPEDMLWQTLWKPPPVRRDESLRCLFWYALLYLVPTGIFTAALNSISYGLCNSSATGPSMAWFCHTKFLQFLFTIILPIVLLMLWQNAVIPANLYKLELRRGAAVSLSGMEANILLIYVGWELVNLFLGGVLSASLVSQIKMLADNPDQWALLLGAAFPNSSNFFLNYVIARAFMMNLFRLIMPHGGMWRWIGQMLFTGFASFKHASTERYRAFIIYPASIRYGREPGLILLVLLMGVAYSVAAPLMTPFVLAYMATAYLVWRYQMIYVCVRAYESGGRMWPIYYGIILWILGLFVVFTSCIFIFKGANVQGVLLLPLLPLQYMFARWTGSCSAVFADRSRTQVLTVSRGQCRGPRTASSPAQRSLNAACNFSRQPQRRTVAGAADASPTATQEVSVEEVMNPHPVILQDSMPIKDAVHKMLDANVSGAPVVDGQGCLVGVLTEADVIWKGAGAPEDHYIIPPVFIGFADAYVYLRDNKRFDEEVHKILARTVAEAMSGKDKVISVAPSTAMSEAAQLMLHHDVNLLPVVEAGSKVVGIVTRHDILRGIYASKSPLL